MSTSGTRKSVAEVPGYLPDTPLHSTRGIDPALAIDFHGHGRYRGIETPEWDHHLICVNIAGTADLTQIRCGKEHRSRFAPGSIITMPAGTTAMWDGTTTPCARIRINPRRLTEMAEETGSNRSTTGDFRNVFHGIDARLTRYAMLLRDELRDPVHSTQRLIVEALSDAIVAHALRAFGCSPHVERDRRRAIDARSVARVSEFIKEHLERGVTLGELASVAGTSRFHFSRSFKAATGLNPMEFVERARVEQAIGLIHENCLTLSEIAVAVGFSDQSHFTRRFRRQTGNSPAAYAREARPSPNGPRRKV